MEANALPLLPPHSPPSSINLLDIELSPDLDPYLSSGFSKQPSLTSAFDSGLSTGSGLESGTLDDIHLLSMPMNLDSEMSDAVPDLDINMQNLGLSSLITETHETRAIDHNTAQAEVPNDQSDQYEFINTSNASFFDDQSRPRPNGRPRKPNPLGPGLSNKELQARMPKLRDPNAPKGEKFTSVYDWLTQGNNVEDFGPMNSLVNAQLIGSEFSEIPSRIIIPDAVDGTVLGIDIDD